MPLIKFQEKTELWVNIDPFTIGETEYQRKIMVTTLIYNPSIQNLLLTEGTVIFFNADGTEAAESHLVKPYLIKMVADNETICDVQTGIPICQKNEIGDENNPDSPVYGKGYSPQFDWFFNLAENVAVKIHDLIRNFYLYHCSIGKCN